MKFLDIPELANLASRFNADVGDRRLSCWLEAYSMKHAGPDKKLYKEFSTRNGGSILSLGLLSPPQTIPGALPTPELCTASRKTLFYLSATLNNVFPDYDFSESKARQFSREPSLEVVAHTLNTILLEGAPGLFIPVRSPLWQCLNDQIDLPQCLVYSYLPVADDPFAEEGTL